MSLEIIEQTNNNITLKYGEYNNVLKLSDIVGHEFKSIAQFAECLKDKEFVQKFDSNGQTLCVTMTYKTKLQDYIFKFSLHRQQTKDEILQELQQEVTDLKKRIKDLEEKQKADIIICYEPLQIVPCWVKTITLTAVLGVPIMIIETDDDSVIKLYVCKKYVKYPNCVDLIVHDIYFQHSPNLELLSQINSDNIEIIGNCPVEHIQNLISNAWNVVKLTDVNVDIDLLLLDSRNTVILENCPELGKYVTRLRNADIDVTCI